MPCSSNARPTRPLRLTARSDHAPRRGRTREQSEETRVHRRGKHANNYVRFLVRLFVGRRRPGTSVLAVREASVFTTRPTVALADAVRTTLRPRRGRGARRRQPHEFFSATRGRTRGAARRARPARVRRTLDAAPFLAPPRGRSGPRRRGRRRASRRLRSNRFSGRGSRRAGGGRHHVRTSRVTRDARARGSVLGRDPTQF